MATRKEFKIIISATDKASGPLKVVQQRIKKIGQSMRSVGRSMTIGLSAPILAFGGFTIKAAADFEQAMNRVRGITRANKDEFEQLNDQAKKLGRTTQFSASQAAGAMEELARAGFSVEEVMSALPAVLELAASSGVELAEAGKLGAGMLKGFGLEAKDLTRLNDKMVTANLGTLTSLTSLVDTIKEIAPLANTMGLDFGEVAAAAGFMGDALLEGGSGGTALKAIISSLTNATPKAQRALNKLGIKKSDLLDSEGNLKSFIAVVKALEDSGAGIQDFFTIFQKRGAPAIAKLVDTGAAKLQKLTDEINGPDSVGEAARQAEIRMEGAAGAMLEFKSAVEGLQIAIGDTGLLAAFTSIVESLTGFMQNFSKSSPTLLKWTTIIAGLVAILGPLLIIIGTIAALIAALSAPVLIGIGVFAGLAAIAAVVIAFWEPLKQFFIDLGEIISGVFSGIDDALSAVRSVLPDFLIDAISVSGLQPLQLAGASAGGGSVFVPPPAQAEVSGKVAVGVKIESDVPARVTTLEASGDVEVDVDSGPGMGGF